MTYTDPTEPIQFKPVPDDNGDIPAAPAAPAPAPAPAPEAPPAPVPS